MPFCSNCGQPLADGAKFCGNCGAPVTSAEPAQPSQPAADTSESTQPAYSTQGGTGYQSYGEQSYQPQQPYGEQSYRPQPSFSTQDGTGYQTQQTYTGNGRIPPDVPSKGKPKTGLIIGIVAAVVVVAAVLIFIFLFTGRDINFAGYWECEGIDYGGVEIVDEVDGIDVSDLAALMLNSDQTFTMTLYGEGSQTGTWSSSGRTVTLTANGESVEMSYRDEELRVDLSSGGETFILYFEYAGARAPAGFGEASVPATTPPSDNVQNTDEPSADPTEVPAADPNVSTELGAEAYYDFGDFTVEILGGQPASDDYTDNCFRVFYRFTNNTYEPTSAWMELYLYAYQDGVELDTDWVDGAETDD